MPTRPKQHQLEDLSRAKFQSILPRDWVVRDKGKDYGVDCEVEIFEHDQTTGFFFWVQLKATESNKESDIMSVSLSIDTLKYYKSLDVPVLLVRYSASNDLFFIKWITNVDLYSNKKNKKVSTTFQIKFDSSDKFTETTSSKLFQYIKKYRQIKSGRIVFPIPISISILNNQINGVVKSLLLSKLRIDLDAYCDYVIVTNDIELAIINIHLNNRELLIEAFQLISCTFHNIEDENRNEFSKEIVKKILLGIATGMLQIGQIEYCGRIIFGCHLEEILFRKEDALIYVLPALFQSSYFEKTIDLLAPILDNRISYDTRVRTAILVHLNANSKSKTKSAIIERFLLSRLDVAIKTKDELTIGISNYNLGNFYRSQAKAATALKYYFAAKKHAPIYKNQYYYWGEIGGLFFGLNRFYFSFKCYQKSINMGAPALNLALCGDALLFCGKYEAANLMFNEYLEKESKPLDEFVLKNICINTLINEYGIKEQHRRPIEAEKLASIKKPSINNLSISDFQKALDLDLLCSLAWFNLGVEYGPKEKFAEATIAFTMCAIAQTTDNEAWINAIISSINLKDFNLMILITRTAYYFNRDEFIQKLYNELTRIESNEYKEVLFELIDQTVSSIKNTDKSTEIRLLGEDGMFKNILNS